MKILSLLQKERSGESNARDYTKYRLHLKNPDMNLYPEKYFLNISATRAEKVREITQVIHAGGYRTKRFFKDS